MIQDTLSKKRRPALTSDRWHVVHARWLGQRGSRPRFERTILSEHDDRGSAVHSAREFLSHLGPKMTERATAERDQLFVRRPGFRSLKNAGRFQRRRK